MAAPRPFLKSNSPLQSPVLCFEKGSRRRDEGKPLRIAVLLGDLSNPFWEEMERAYRAAAKDRAMTVEFFRARPEKDREAQAGALLDIITMPFDAIVVNPISSKNLAPGIIRAAAAGIPVLDVGAKTEVFELMDELARSGAAVLMVSSEMQELLQVADRILVMRQGRISGELPGRTTQEEIMRYAALDRVAAP